MAIRKIRQSPKLPPDQRREQLLTAAYRLFARDGYQGTTVDQIAKEAGVTKGAVYFHFKSKEDIMYHLVKSIEEAYDDQVEEMFTQGVTPAAFLQMLFHHDAHCSEGKFAEVVQLWVQGMRLPRVRRYLSGRITTFVELFSERLDPDLKIDKKTARRLGFLTLAIHTGLSVYRFQLGTEIDLSDQIKFFDTLLSGGLPRRKSASKGRRK